MSIPAELCQQCGAPIPASALGAVCPSCLMGGLWDDEPAQSAALFTIHGHEVLRELGRGGMGIVYLARQHDPPREVALKMLLPAQGMSAEMRERFRMEAATVAALDHPNILPVYATGEHDGLPWFTLKLAGGGSLAERTAGYRGQWRGIAELLATLAEAVHFAHQRGVLHRDLKPGNVLFDEQSTPYVSDFGLAKWIAGEKSTRHSLTMDGSTMGTPHYLSPEAAKKGAAAATAASDVYALGAILYELLAGHPPFTAESTPELMRQIYEVPAPALPPEVPGDLCAVAMKCLEKEPAARYDSAHALAEDLQSWLDGRGVKARPVRAVVRLWRWARRNPALAGTAVALLAALTAGAVLQIRSYRQLRTALAESLLAQARMTTAGTAQGSRDAALRLLREADAQGAAATPELSAMRRSEIARALALPELTPAATWLVSSGSSDGSESFSPDLSTYLAATPDGGFAQFDSATRVALNSWPPVEKEREPRKRAPALRMNSAPHGRLAAVIFAGDSSVPAEEQVVSLESGRTLISWPCAYDSREWPVWLEDGGFLFANTRSPSCVRLSADATQSAPWPSAERAANVQPLALSPDAVRVLVALRAEKALAVLSLADGAEVWRTPLLALPWSVAWSPDGALIAAGEGQGATLPDEKEQARPGHEVLLFDASTGALRAALPGHQQQVAQVCFLHGSRSVVSTSTEQGLLWQETVPGGFRLAAPAQPRVLQADATGTRLAWSPAQGTLSTGSATLPSGWQVWPENAGATVTCAATSADGTRLFLASRQGLRIHDTAGGRLLHRRDWPAAFTRSWPWFVVTPDDSQIIMGDQGQPLHAVAVTSSADGTPHALLGDPQPRGPSEFYMIHDFTAQGGWVVCDGPAGRTVQRGRTYSIWPDGDHTRARVVARDITASTMHVLGSDARWALSAARNGRDCDVWDAHTGTSPGTVGLEDAVGITSSRDHSWAMLSGRFRMTLWDAATQRTGASWPTPPGVAGTLPQFSPDGRLLASHDRSGTIFLHEVPSGELSVSLTVPGGFPLWDVQWAGARRLIGIGTDGRLGEWDLDETEQAAAAAGLPW